MSRGWRIADSDWNHWPDGLSDQQLWPEVAAAGLTGVEVGVYDVHTELSPHRLDEREKLAATHGVAVAAMLLSLPGERWPDGALTGRPEAVAEQVRGCARACRRFGLGTLGVWP
ncbi:MAG TPA: hypothetical protein VGD43_21065, partial [Micromonospora sp.]